VSAYVVDPETIDRIATAVDLSRNDYQDYPSHWVGILERHGCPVKPAFLGAAMHALNVEAVHQRYPDDDTPDTLPGPVGPKVYSYKTFRVSMMSRCTTLKAMHCWLYQCSEGNAPERPLFKAIEEISQDLAYRIVCELPEYEKAPW